MSGLFGTPKTEDESEWLSVSDLMAGLMVIFLFVAIVFIRPVAEENAKIKEIAVTWQEAEVGIYEALIVEFEQNLAAWNAEIERETLLVRFKSPEVLFTRGDSTLKSEFRTILTDFFPRYISVLSEFRTTIDEIRIEGHTSSEWTGANSSEAYFNNMALSQARTREVLRYVLSIPDLSQELKWTRVLLTANGLSSSRPILTELGIEDPLRSKRVEFRVRTKARSEIVRILEATQ